ncbi:conserved hypothetical protein [Streptomyces pristinaespiralis ATCC 25486]|uniref:Uncharacterized protein n=2 Tax=Streptomyces pristinaespiralis TaxID=38300 RepID=B5HJE0_STRE2|nr:hypothetical protein SPRI_1184 [Streptomyces pristinaespiralis]EDY66951.1 conserved hypothetical protein [Streptomyces pristinaespiralis ATCC 25486]
MAAALRGGAQPRRAEVPADGNRVVAGQVRQVRADLAGLDRVEVGLAVPGRDPDVEAVRARRGLRKLSGSPGSPGSPGGRDGSELPAQVFRIGLMPEPCAGVVRTAK